MEESLHAFVHLLTIFPREVTYLVGKFGRRTEHAQFNSSQGFSVFCPGYLQSKNAISIAFLSVLWYCVVSQVWLHPSGELSGVTSTKHLSLFSSVAKDLHTHWLQI